MDAFEKKYGYREDEKVKAFHRSRRMFCIKDGVLHIAPARVQYSHATWFANEGWITPQDDSLMKTVIRGIVDKKGNIYFYTGYDFKVNQQTQKELMKKLMELKKD